MEGLLVYNGRGDSKDWYKVFCVTPKHYFYSFRPETALKKPYLTAETKKHFKVGGPKLLIQW